MADTGTAYVVDDDPATCDLIQATLSRRGLAVRTFPSADAIAGVDLCAQANHGPCCLLLDLEMPGTSGLEFLRQYAGKTAPCPVIIVTGHGSIKAAVESMKLGAIDFLEKPFSTDGLAALVLDTLVRHRCGCSKAQEKEGIRARLDSLSPRERELLGAIVQGKSTKMIADALGISARTVDHHRANLMSKMGATNVADLVRMAVEADFHAPEKT